MPLNSDIKSLIEQASVRLDPSEYLERSEFGDAELFALLFSGQALFDHSERAWYLWDGSHWQPDDTGAVLARVADAVAAKYLEAAAEAQARGEKSLAERFRRRARDLCRMRRARSVLEIAATLPGIALHGDEWQLPPMTLPVANGIVDLATGTLSRPEPEDRIRSYSPTSWAGLDCPAPRWDRLLEGVFGCDPDMIRFYQRLCGYAVSGDRSEQVLPILYGSGANGKSTLVDALSSVLGPQLCFTTQSDSLMDMGRSAGNEARPFIAALRDKRLVWASESHEGARLNVGLAKQLTGDESITARNLYAGPVTFKQSHTIMLITNHRPRFPDSDDEALWRRVLLVPFGQRFLDEPRLPNEHPRQRDVGAGLRQEASGILAWLVRGCLEWKRVGLQPPASVRESTAQYRADEDVIGQYMNERLVVGEGLEVTAAALYRDYTGWCERMGIVAVAQRALGLRISARFGATEAAWDAGRTRRRYPGLGLLT